MRPQLVEALAHARLDDVLELDHAERPDATVRSSASATTSGVPPWAGDAVDRVDRARRDVPPCSSTQRRTESAAPLRIGRPVEVDAAHAGLGGERHERRRRRARARGCRSCSSASTTIERPSGVSSARLESSAASASSCSVTPGTGRNAVGLAVAEGDRAGLVEQQRAQSPAASTARPLIASTLRCTRRSMPAMPIADSSPPIVVGIRHTSSATSTMIDCSASRVDRERLQRDDREQEDEREPGEQDVRARSRSGSSGARRPRRARSSGRGTSRPGSAVMRTTISSDSTRVPPVTAERSPPDSRMTGADSPVMADSSTLAMPSTTSPSLGIDLARGHDDDGRRPARSALADLLDAAVGRRDGARWSRRGSCAACRPAPCRVPRRPPRRSWRTAR